MLVWSDNFKDTCLVRNANMDSLIKSNTKKQESKGKWTEREYHVQNDAYILHKYVICFVIQKNLQHCHFVVHTQNHMVPEGLVVHLICTILRIPCACYEFASMLYKTWIHGLTPKNNTATNLSLISLTGQFWAPSTTVISSHFHTQPQQGRLLRIFIKLYLV